MMMTTTKLVHPDNTSMCNVLTTNGDRHIIRNTVKTEMSSVHSMKSGPTSSRHHHRTAARRHSQCTPSPTTPDGQRMTR